MQPISPFAGATALASGARVAGPNRFVVTRQIRFGHCDPAAIVFYPQYVLLFHETQEDFFQYGLGVDYHAMIAANCSTPVVRLDSVFYRPSRMGDIVDFAVSLESLGTSSIAAIFECIGPDGLRARATLKLVVVDHAVRRTMPIPAELRSRLEHFMNVGAF
jgi:4-hydroxybenzoyl-CoA thioesterase